MVVIIQAGFMKAQMSTKQAYSDISLIMRGFVGAVLQLNASRMTTNQISRRMKKGGVGAVPQRRFLDLLKRSDLVKFAKENPERTSVVDDIDESIGIVREIHNADGTRDNKGEKEA